MARQVSQRSSLDGFPMKEAARMLFICERKMRDLVKRHPFYYPNGNRKLFTHSDVLALRLALRKESGRFKPNPLDRELEALEQAREKRTHYTNPNGFIYFIRVEGYVKIGFSRLGKSRYYHINTASPFPVTTLAVTVGTRYDEKQLHKRFGAHRHKGEWFRYEGELADFIAGLPK